ncbi:DUF4430 domain-containing protein [Tepidimicrobium xylanilyticum]|uniref:DUF4430 domain-containing protein n=1 Tax=Tepidimicrobium xylanilyticum TaxID=1123352 RepID=UPI002655B8D6|nr:DUF4430 domain-containing protein [Tepidimicrobium xylanilyticum]GMG96718.1 hypothetical protein EN5CB1_15440 [Tepidimicrobium xylanilyticum]
MNKKIIAIILVLIVTVLLFVGYKAFLSPKGVEGQKLVTIHVINKNEDVDKTFEYNTDHNFLLELLEEKEEELGVTFEKYDFGTMVTGMLGYVADPNNQEYFHIYINGKDATTGPGEIPLTDGDTYTFELKNY